MTKADLVKSIAQETGISKADTQLVINMYMKSIKDAIRKGEKVYLRKFGTFQAKQRAERVARNIHTRKRMVRPAKKVATFKTSRFFLQKE